MTLPIDRSTLALAQGNQTPGIVAASAKNINAMTNVYNTVDELYAFTTGLISAGTLSRLGIINVKDYGAVGDGVANDHAAINAAISAMSSSGGGVAFVPEGTYLITGNILLCSNVMLMGCYNSILNLKNAQIQVYGNAGSNIKIFNLDIQFDALNTTNFDLINITGTTGTHLTDIEIVECRVNGNALGTGGIYIQYVDRINVYRNKIQYTGNADGIVVYDSNDVRIINNDIKYIGRSGIKLFTNCANVLIEGNFVSFFMLRREVSDGGIDSYGPTNSNVRIVNNTVDSGTTAAYTTGKHTCIRIAGSTDYVIKNNILITRSTTVNAIASFEDRVGTYSDHIIFKDNIIKVQTNISYVIRVNGCDHTVIEGNKIEVTAAITIGAFVEIRSTAKSVTFKSNEIDMNSVSAYIITVYNAITVTDLKICDNTIVNAASLLLGASGGIVTRAVVNGNSYVTSGSNALYFYTTIAKIIVIGNILNSASTTIANQNNGTTIQSVDNNLVTSGSLDIQGTTIWDPASLVDGTGETSAAVTVTGAAFGDFVDVAAPYDLQGITCNGYVSAANTVKIRIQNETGGTIDLVSGTWKVRVRKQN